MKFLLGFLLCCASLFAYEDPCALASIGGGYWDAGKHHSGGLVQIEYKWGTYYFGYIRPQATLASPNCNSLFFGVGLGIELYMSPHMIFCPNFCPGLYYKGSGRNLGFPLEFRSALEMAYEFNNKSRLGVQFYHISNAHLGNKNPGANALTLYFAVPFNNY